MGLTADDEKKNKLGGGRIEILQSGKTGRKDC